MTSTQKPFLENIFTQGIPWRSSDQDAFTAGEWGRGGSIQKNQRTK